MQIETSKLKKIFKEHNITYAALFGSYVNDDASENSDVDILFDYDSNYKFSLFDLIGIQKKIEDVLDREVDFVPRKGLKAGIKEEILNSAVTIYQRT
jgi:hypothetical protein